MVNDNDIAISTIETNRCHGNSFMVQRLKRHALGYLELAEKPSLEELRDYYATKYYQEGRGSYELEYSEEEVTYFKAKLEQCWFVIKNYLSSETERRSMLDVGCGEGYALAFFRQKGWQVRGLDFSAAGVESKNPSCADALVTGNIVDLLESEIQAKRRYDVLLLQNVLEHLLDPVQFLLSLREIIKKDGVAVVTVPNDGSITQQAALEQKHIDSAFWIAPPDHLSYFDKDSLRNIAEHTEWDCVQMFGDFPVDWFIFHPGSNYVRDKSLGKAAHMAKVQIENMIHTQPLDAIIEFWTAAAKVGLGRNITIILQNRR